MAWPVMSRSGPDDACSALIFPLVPAADISTVIVDKPQKAVLLLEHMERKETPGLKLVILMEPFEDTLRERGQKCGVNIKSMKAIEVRICISDVCWMIAGWLAAKSQLPAN